MYRALGAFLSARNGPGPDTSAENGSVVSSSCRLLSFSSSDIIRAVSVSVAVPSGGRAEELIAGAEELAATYGLIASVELAGGRLRVRFLRQLEERGTLSDRQ